MPRKSTSKPAAKKPAVKKPVAKKAAPKKPSAAEALKAKLQKAEEEKKQLAEENKELQQAVDSSSITVTIKHGLSRSITRTVPPNTTIQQLTSDPDVRAVLGHGENVTAIQNGITLDASQLVSSIAADNQASFSLENKSNGKA